MHTLRKLILSTILFILGIQFAQAGKEPEIKQVLPRSGVSFALNNTALTYDAVLLQSSCNPTGISPGTYSLFNVKNMVYLDIDQSQINHFYMTQFSVSVDIEINSKDENGTAHPTQYITLTIDYDSTTLYRYTEKNSFTFDSAYWVEAKITGINNSAAV